MSELPLIGFHQFAARGRWVEVSWPNGLIAALLPPPNLMGVPPHPR